MLLLLQKALFELLLFVLRDILLLFVSCYCLTEGECGRLVACSLHFLLIEAFVIQTFAFCERLVFSITNLLEVSFLLIDESLFLDVHIGSCRLDIFPI